MISTAIGTTVLSHPLQVLLMAMVVGKMTHMGLVALTGRVEKPEGERIAILGSRAASRRLSLDRVMEAPRSS
jgi:hypothetical protein